MDSSILHITDLAPLKEYSPKVIKQMVKDCILYLRHKKVITEIYRPSRICHYSLLLY